MSDRVTVINGPAIGGFAMDGRRTRAEMIRLYRESYQRQLEDAQKALATSDEDLKVYTYLGVWAQRNKEEVTE